MGKKDEKWNVHFWGYWGEWKSDKNNSKHGFTPFHTLSNHMHKQKITLEEKKNDITTITDKKIPKNTKKSPRTDSNRESPVP